MFSFQIDWNTVLSSLNLMWMGMLTIFIVIIVIFIAVRIMLAATGGKKEGRSESND